MTRMKELEQAVREAADLCVRLRAYSEAEREAALREEPEPVETTETASDLVDRLDILVQIATEQVDTPAGQRLLAELSAELEQTAFTVDASIEDIGKAQKAVLADLRSLDRGRKAIRAYTDAQNR